jgi:hypothetical protein
VPGSRHDRQDQLRARARLVDERAAEAMALMADGRWVTGKSHRELAERWGVDLAEVQHVAQRAGQALRVLMLVDRDDIRARNAATLEAIAADARADGDHAAAVRAVEAGAKLLGLNAPDRVETTTRTVEAEFDALPPADKVAWLRAQASAFLAAAERVEQEMRDAGALVTAAEPLPTE